MTAAIQAEPSPLTVDKHGTIHVGKSRVTLDTLVYHFNNGASAEEVALRFPAVALADVYAAIGYYLHHRGELDEYIAESAQRAQDTRAIIEAKYPTAEIRAKLLALKQARS